MIENWPFVEGERVGFVHEDEDPEDPANQYIGVITKDEANSELDPSDWLIRFEEPLPDGFVKGTIAHEWELYHIIPVPPEGVILDLGELEGRKYLLSDKG